MSVWSTDLCRDLLEAWLTVRSVCQCEQICICIQNAHAYKVFIFMTLIPCFSFCVFKYVLIISSLLKFNHLCFGFSVFCKSAHAKVVCVCVWNEVPQALVCPCLLVMDTNGPGQASMEQGARFVCLTPSCPHLTLGGEGLRGGQPCGDLGHHQHA